VPVVQRMANLTQINPEVLRRAEGTLREKVRAQGQIVTQEVDGQAVLAEILRNMAPGPERAIMDSLERQDHALAKALSRRLMTMDVLFAIPDRDLEKLLRDFSETELARLSRGLSDEHRARLRANLSERRWELVEQAWQAGRGILFLTPHLGCFEITAQYYAARAPITVLYRRPKQAWLQPLIESGRGSANFRLAPADLSGVRLLLKALKRREAAGMLPDQVPGVGEGHWAEFFGRPAYTMTLGARLSATERTTVLLAFAERLPGGSGFHLRFRAPAIAGTLAERVVAINRALEDLIRSCPQQYLWGYNRYKAPRGSGSPAEPPC